VGAGGVVAQFPTSPRRTCVAWVPVGGAGGAAQLPANAWVAGGCGACTVPADPMVPIGVGCWFGQCSTASRRHTNSIGLPPGA
jgi:hypothetical protein